MVVPGAIKSAISIGELRRLRIFVAVGIIALAAAALFFYNSPAVQHDRAAAGSRVPAQLGEYLSVGFLLPALISLSLLSLTYENVVLAGAAVACVYFGATLILSPFALLGVLLGLGLSANERGFDDGLLAAAVALLILLIVSLRIFRPTWRACDHFHNRSALPAVLTSLYLYALFHAAILIGLKSR